ncbi:MAG TPA: hypothetical protein ENJ82_16455 [Bacteroidetes bacterium]|nr:hypothetical protein [Bacteroidota bacterium]
MKIVPLIILCFFSVLLLAVPLTKGGKKAPKDKIGGVSLVSPSKRIDDAWVNPIQQMNADWVAILPYGFSSPGSPKVHFNLDRQWWGERFEGMREIIRHAKNKGLKVMLKPMVWVPGSWPGGVDMETEAEWKAWEKEYSRFIFAILKVAAEEEVDMFCVGTEYKLAVRKRAIFWRALIDGVRSQFDGAVTYAANWDDFQEVTFWNKLDYIGIDAYFPLSPAKTARVSELKRQWFTPIKNLELLHKVYKKPILFTEFGYRSTDACTWKQWEIQDIPYHELVNLNGQTNAYQAFFESFWSKDWFAGVFLWQWYANDETSGGLVNSDYTPQNKPAEAVIKEWFGK